MRVPWTQRSNQSILKEINPEYLLEGLLLKLNIQYFGHLMLRKDVKKGLKESEADKGDSECDRWDDCGLERHL